MEIESTSPNSIDKNIEVRTPTSTLAYMSFQRQLSFRLSKKENFYRHRAMDYDLLMSGVGYGLCIHHPSLYQFLILYKYKYKLKSNIPTFVLKYKQ